MTPGGAASGAKGSAYERELVDRFTAAGWGCIRLGGSGSGGDADLPDVLAGGPIHIPGYEIPGEKYADGEIHTFARLKAVELKSGKADILYADAAEVDALRRFARTWGATPYLGVRSTQQATPTATFLLAPEAARRTDSGRYAVDVAGVADVASVVVADGEVDVHD